MITKEVLQADFKTELQRITGEQIDDCFQCGKCSAGCPVVTAMDLLPHQVIRLAQLGLEEKALNSKTIWICASCFTCASRCPRDVDLARVMEGMRMLVLRQKGANRLKPEELPTELFKDTPQQAYMSGFRKYAKG